MYLRTCYQCEEDLKYKLHLNAFFFGILSLYTAQCFPKILVLSANFLSPKSRANEATATKIFAMPKSETRNIF